MAPVSLFWDTNMAAVKSGENTLFRMWMVVVTFSNLKSGASKFFPISGKIFKTPFSSLFLLKFFIRLFFAISFQLSTTMYNFCVVLARYIFGKKKIVWGGIAWLRESWFSDVQDSSRLLRISPSGWGWACIARAVTKTEHIWKRKKEPRWNLHENSANG